MPIQDTLKDRENNFTLLRLLAAMAVLFGHSWPLSLGLNGSEDPISTFLIKFTGESLPSLAVDLFFVTSGFLVTASYIQRENLFEFIEARILRIFPGLVFAVFFCVFAGYLVTTEPKLNYFLSPATWSYLKHNIFLVNGIQFDLPGVFLNNPYPLSVNGSLWTLPIEILMYVWVAVLGYLSLLKDKKSFNLFFIVLCLMYAQSSGNNFFIAHEPRTAQLAFLFMLGSFFYVNRDTIYLNFACFAALILSVYMTLHYPFSLFIKSILFSYFTLLLALHPKLRLPSIDDWGDISYGLYIYAFPTQQLVAYLMPQIHPINLFIISSVITIILAAVSWHSIEKPALKMKGKLSFGRFYYDIRDNN
ncbi:acyltransferase family protein [Candidatus Methylobacter oryzae]|uniref:Acyltransferase n=1 Tax=Candidatus Methylobacter oryzae TaxID=2497749 RepID=A0ABY3C7X2_9GAMM|nr:acyltransferase [Candidatus Methylobacter oryzae]TRW92203.1 acyltransferase [Candidatus Methylobacter oryzae]